jgi:single-strand DNA-binding protein
MAAKKSGPAEPVNEVRLVGRVSSAPERRSLPSGDELLGFRLVVDRPPESYRGRQRVDVLDCVVWRGRAARTVAGWAPGDTVEVLGQIRKRFFAAAGGTGSRVEIELCSGRLIRRAATA